MKTNHFFTIISILVLIISACQPRDKAVITPKEREQLEGLKQARKQSSGLLKLGSFGAAAFMVDQQAETLNWLMYMLDGAYIGNGYTVSQDKENERNFPLLKNIGSLKENSQGQYNIIGELELNLRRTEQDQFEKLTINGQELNRFESPALGLYANLSDRRVIDIQADGENQYLVQMEKNGEIEINKNDKIEKVKVQLTTRMTVQVDQQQNLVNVVQSVANLKIFRQPELNFKIQTENQFKYQFNQSCIQAIGQVQIIDLRNSAKNKLLSIDEKNIQVQGTSWTYPVESCEKRVLVDLNKLLKY